MSVQLRLTDLHNAYQAGDPELAPMVAALAVQADPEPDTPIREGAPTFDRFLAEIRSKAFRKKSREEQARYRIAQIQALESSEAEVPLPDRLRLHEILQALWEDDSPFARNCLLEIIARIRLTYGPWRALKKIAKEAEAREDTEILGALAARFDMACASGDHDVSPGTLGYMCRRIWRYLRQMGKSFPAGYADAAADVLACYTDQTAWRTTWIANHILFHDLKTYSRYRFVCHRSSPADMLRYRAYPKLWQRSFRPLLSLLERARSRRVRGFAVAALKKDFRAAIREIGPEWVIRLISAGHADAHEFAVWLLSNVPRFEQSAFRKLGLHEPVLRLFDSASAKARIYAAEYARTHARDLPTDTLIRLLNNDEKAVRGLAKDLIRERDPRKEVGLAAWGQLLETRYGHDFAAQVLEKHFTARELTPDWFRERILSGQRQTFGFAVRLLPRVHPTKKLGPDYFCDILKELDESPNPLADRVADFAFDELARFDVNTLEADFLRRGMIHPEFGLYIRFWIEEGRLAPATLGADFFKMLAYHPDWEQSAWVAQLRESGLSWTKALSFNEELSAFAMGLLKDVRLFSASDLGFEWLMGLVGRSESRYHRFAVSVMVRAFVPGDFARSSEAAPETPAETPSDEISVDFGGTSFVFTGKLATMTRKEAQKKVTQANGKNASGVTGKLGYLVIGDEGSPLYGQGRKGSKQVKAEKLIEGGAGIRIISEAAFLQMLAGKQAEASEDAQMAGCERLWEMVAGPGHDEDPFRQFAVAYILRHHPDICLAETDRPVDPGAEIPGAFLSPERIFPLLSDERTSLRRFALKLAQWEFARWSPDATLLSQLCETPYPAVRAFVIRSLTAEDTPEHRRYRLDGGIIDTDAVMGFCESVHGDIRHLGMALIRRYSAYQEPDALFGLTESPDRQIRAFAVRILWTLYRDRGITGHWEPAPETETPKSPPKKRKKKTEPVEIMAPVPRPDALPASHDRLREVLRRILFEIPPGRLEKAEAEVPDALPRLAPLPTRKAKLCLVETLRDLAIEDAALAETVLPLLREFMGSRGMSEQAACLVAVTRIQKAHSYLSVSDSRQIMIIH